MVCLEGVSPAAPPFRGIGTEPDYDAAFLEELDRLTGREGEGPHTVLAVPDGKRRSAILGRTENGRFLIVVFTFRNGFPRVVTARDATPNEKRRYRRT